MGEAAIGDMMQTLTEKFNREYKGECYPVCPPGEYWSKHIKSWVNTHFDEDDTVFHLHEEYRGTGVIPGFGSGEVTLEVIKNGCEISEHERNLVESYLLENFLKQNVELYFSYKKLTAPPVAS